MSPKPSQESKLRSLVLVPVPVLLVSLGALASCGTEQRARPPTNCAATLADTGAPICTRCDACEDAKCVTSYNHVLGPVSYPDPPPVGGDHYPCWAKWGVHTEVVPPERWVHNLEHGGI